MAKSITASVGRMGGVNRPNDVRTVQELLNKIPVTSGGPIPLLETDGVCGKKTIDAIQKFQLHHFGWQGADGRVDPGGQTLRKLNELADPQAPPPALSSRFQVRLVEPFFQNPPGLNIIAYTRLFQFVDTSNNLTSFYFEEVLNPVNPNLGDSLLWNSFSRVGLFTPFILSEAVSVTQFGGPAIVTTVRLGGARELVVLQNPTVAGKSTNTSIRIQGLDSGDLTPPVFANQFQLIISKKFKNPSPFSG